MKAATDELSVYLQTSAISIHAAREGGDVNGQIIDMTSDISIHAAREGGDRRVILRFKPHFIISIHAAREGGDASMV